MCLSGTLYPAERTQTKLAQYASPPSSPSKDASSDGLPSRRAVLEVLSVLGTTGGFMLTKPDKNEAESRKRMGMEKKKTRMLVDPKIKMLSAENGSVTMG